MRNSVLKRREKRRRERWARECIPVDIPYSKDLKDASNETLFVVIGSGAAPEALKDEALLLLTERMKKIIFSKAPPFYRKLRWDSDDAVAEGMELIWGLAMGKKYDRRRGHFVAFFRRCYANRIANVYRRGMRHHPDLVGDVCVARREREPVYWMGCRFDTDYILRDNRMGGGKKG